MRSETVVESRPALLDLTEAEARLLQAAGRRLVGSTSYWNSGDAAEDAERTVIRCAPDGNGRYRVLVSEAVGIIALPDLQIVVEPKIPLPHFRHLLERSSTIPRLDDGPTGAAESMELWDLVAGWYASALESLLRRGLLSDYTVMTDDLPAIRGSLLVRETAEAYYAGRMTLACEFDEFETDSPLNRVLFAAAAAVAGSPMLEATVRRRARRAMARLDGVSALRPGDLQTPLDRRTGYYKVPFELARHVLAATGRTVASGDAQAWTFLIRTPDLVEDAIRSILRAGLADVVRVTKRGLQLQGSMHRLNPDLVFGTTAVGDVKYKLDGADWRRSDLYQSVAFATGFRVNECAVVGFTAGGPALPDLRVGKVMVHSFSWQARTEVDPGDASDQLVSAVRAWLLEALHPATTAGVEAV